VPPPSPSAPNPNLPNPQSPSSPQNPQGPQAPSGPQSPNLPNPQTPQGPQIPNVPQGPPQTPQVPQNPQSPQNPQGPQGPQIPNAPGPNLPNPQAPPGPQAPQNPQPQNPQDLFSTLSDLVDQVAPLIEGAIVLAKVTGAILKATNPDEGPPPTYYIGMDPNNPTAPSSNAPPSSGPGFTPIGSVGIDQAGGFTVTGPSNNVLLGSGLAPVAVLGLSMVNGSPLVTANGTILIGPGQQPLAGQGSVSAYGPLVDSNPDGVFMQTSLDMQGVPKKHTLYNVAGTTATWDNDFTASIASQVNGERYYWQGVSYPAATFPMGPSVKAGVEELVRLITEKPGTFAIMGYSQGAIVTCKVWRDEIMNPAGRLHDRKHDIFGHVTFGNPLRCPGYANGNPLAGLPPPANEFGTLTGGIAGPDDLTPWQTMPWHIDFAHDGDLFTTCPTGPDPWSNEMPAGEHETSIYKLVQGEIAGHQSILQQVGEILTDPLDEAVPLVLAMIDAFTFLAHNTHGYDDSRDAAIKWLKDRGNQVPVT